MASTTPTMNAAAPRTTAETRATNIGLAISPMPRRRLSPPTNGRDRLGLELLEAVQRLFLGLGHRKFDQPVRPNATTGGRTAAGRRPPAWSSPRLPASTTTTSPSRPQRRAAGGLRLTTATIEHRRSPRSPAVLNSLLGHENRGYRRISERKREPSKGSRSAIVVLADVVDQKSMSPMPPPPPPPPASSRGRR